MSERRRRRRSSGSGRAVGPYIVSRKLGSGSYSIVWKAKHRSPPHQRVAIKAISKNRLDEKTTSLLQQEIGILKKITDANIVTFIDKIETERTVYLVFEYCDQGDVHKYIRTFAPLSEHCAQHFMLDLAKGLHFLWRNSFIHRDLKPHNLFLVFDAERHRKRKRYLLPNSKKYKNVNGNSFLPKELDHLSLTLKIGDFGFAKHLAQQSLAETLCGSPLYMAPEILFHQNYDAKADLWSVGTILYELVTRKTPYTGANAMDLAKNIRTKSYNVPKFLTNECVQLLQSLLRRNPVQRSNFPQFFKSTFMQPRFSKILLQKVPINAPTTTSVYENYYKQLQSNRTGTSHQPSSSNQHSSSSNQHSSSSNQHSSSSNQQSSQPQSPNESSTRQEQQHKQTNREQLITKTRRTLSLNKDIHDDAKTASTRRRNTKVKTTIDGAQNSTQKEEEKDTMVENEIDKGRTKQEGERSRKLNNLKQAESEIQSGQQNDCPSPSEQRSQKMSGESVRNGSQIHSQDVGQGAGENIGDRLGKSDTPEDDTQQGTPTSSIRKRLQLGLGLGSAQKSKRHLSSNVSSPLTPLSSGKMKDYYKNHATGRSSSRTTDRPGEDNTTRENSVVLGEHTEERRHNAITTTRLMSKTANNQNQGTVVKKSPPESSAASFVSSSASSSSNSSSASAVTSLAEDTDLQPLQSGSFVVVPTLAEDDEKLKATTQTRSNNSSRPSINADIIANSGLVQRESNFFEIMPGLTELPKTDKEVKKSRLRSELERKDQERQQHQQDGGRCGPKYENMTWTRSARDGDANSNVLQNQISNREREKNGGEMKEQDQFAEAQKYERSLLIQIHSQHRGDLVLAMRDLRKRADDASTLANLALYFFHHVMGSDITTVMGSDITTVRGCNDTEIGCNDTVMGFIDSTVTGRNRIMTLTEKSYENFNRKHLTKLIDSFYIMYKASILLNNAIQSTQAVWNSLNSIDDDLRRQSKEWLQTSKEKYKFYINQCQTMHAACLAYGSSPLKERRKTNTTQTLTWPDGGEEGDDVSERHHCETVKSNAIAKKEDTPPQRKHLETFSSIQDLCLSHNLSTSFTLSSVLLHKVRFFHAKASAHELMGTSESKQKAFELYLYAIDILKIIGSNHDLRDPTQVRRQHQKRFSPSYNLSRGFERQKNPAVTTSGGELPSTNAFTENDAEKVYTLLLSLLDKVDELSDDHLMS